jgi:hypothetical protein
MAIGGKNVLACCRGLFSSRYEPGGAFHKNTRSSQHLSDDSRAWSRS